MNKILLLIISIPVLIFAYNAPEYIDTEFIVDEESVSYDECILYDFLYADNYSMISGGCYNVEWLAMSDFLKLSIPVGGPVYFTYMKMSVGRIEYDYDLFGFGLSWHINKWVNIGFLANPLFEKRESDISLNMGFQGYNTKNQLLVTMTNFDNNYAHKNNNDRYPYPRLYTSPYIPFNSTSYFPIDIFFTSVGYIKSMNFLFVLKTGTGFSSDYYVFDETLGDVYTHSADSSDLFMQAGLINRSEGDGYGISNGIFLSSMIMNNAYRDSIYSNAEYDSRFNVKYAFEYSKGLFSIPLTLEYRERQVMADTVELYRLKSLIGGLGLEFSPGNWDIELKQLFNAYRSAAVNDSLELTQSRLQLSVAYNFSDYAYFMVRKGFETDPADVAAGGKFFFYDKMYVQFVCNIDKLFKEHKWIDL